jgi:parvulin-like peptidyl-prolyl isomerase
MIVRIGRVRFSTQRHRERRDTEKRRNVMSKNYFAKTVIATLMLMAVLCLPGRCVAQQVVDKMVATVNAGVKTELITYSDLLWQLALQPDTPLDNPSSADLNRALRLLIDQRLILQEAEKLPTIAPTQKEINDARDELARNFASAGEFQQRLQRVGLTSEKLDEIIDQRLRMEKYLDFRFRSFVVITPEEIADYYRNVYVPRIRARGRVVPTQEEARAEIERALTEGKIESDTDAFLDTARERAEIVMLNPV